MVCREGRRAPLVATGAQGADRSQAAPALRRRDRQLQGRLGDIEGHAALAVTKDPYILDLIDVAEDVKERELEDALVSEIPRFLRELGVGFAFYGRQQPLDVGGQEFFLDLLF
jgi:predicted nuclease of restriction endonuclease-like (RecB) superfamily